MNTTISATVFGCLAGEFLRLAIAHNQYLLLIPCMLCIFLHVVYCFMYYEVYITTG